MREEKLNKIGNIVAVIVLLIVVMIIWGLTSGIDALFWIFIVAEFVFGPACFILYLIVYALNAGVSAFASSSSFISSSRRSSEMEKPAISMDVM